MGVVLRGSNQGEYWGEVCQTYFDTQRVNNWNHNFVGTREQLRDYDPEGYELARTAFNLTPANDWRYTPLRKLPNITAPPAKFGVDPWYTKFTWAREFTVVGRGASDAAMLRANDVVRKMFAYRHDILKALIADSVKLVVLGRNERIADLPEYKRLADTKERRQVAVVGRPGPSGQPPENRSESPREEETDGRCPATISTPRGSRARRSAGCRAPVLGRIAPASGRVLAGA